MDKLKLKEFISKVGLVKSNQVIESAELIEAQAEEWGIRSKQKDDQVKFIGDMSPESFKILLQETFAEALGKKTPAAKPGKAPAGGKKKTREQTRPERKLGENEKPGSGRRRTQLRNTEKPKPKPKPKSMAEKQKEIRAKGVDVGFLSFILPTLGKAEKIRTKDGSKSQKRPRFEKEWQVFKLIFGNDL